MERYKHKLPNKYRGRGKKIGSIIRLPSEPYVDVLISKTKECNKCKCFLDFKNEYCSRCKDEKLITVYTVLRCKNIGICKVNRWGCSIHYKRSTHGFTCVCDECM